MLLMGVTPAREPSGLQQTTRVIQLERWSSDSGCNATVKPLEGNKLLALAVLHEHCYPRVRLDTKRTFSDEHLGLPVVTLKQMVTSCNGS